MPWQPKAVSLNDEASLLYVESATFKLGDGKARMMEDQKWPLACHEFGHAAIEWHFRDSLEDEGVVVDVATGKGQFCVRTFYTAELIEETLRKTTDEQTRAIHIRAVERIIIRLLGGPVAEYIARGWEPKRAIRFSSEYRFPDSDSSRIREFLRGLTGKDDKQYQLRLQNECKAILTEERTWRAVEHLAKMVLEHGQVLGPEIEAVY